ncbi:MAG TPA: LuxR C-terminal-related transcriptional regulator [Thermoleophilaceae bacterium]|nr:LuxR C-terminal-related transcriptional regulator [Thermoleophilaceae bacterium]
MSRGAVTSSVQVEEDTRAGVRVRYSIRVRSASYAGRGLGSSIELNGRFGRRAPAPKLIDEAEAIIQASGTTHPICTSLVLAAWRGQETRALELIEASVNDAPVEHKRLATTQAEYARAVLYNGLGGYDTAFAAARRASEDDRSGLVEWALSELVEAGARSGRLDAAATALRRLERRTRDSRTDWALGIEARSRALIEGDGAEDHHREALDRLAGAGVAPHLARARLVYGEWLRRAGRRVDAREQLRAAQFTFGRIGAEGFGERTRRELSATGETVRKRTDETRDQLTPQEEQIARLACDGHTNPEIGAQLFLSPRTVEWHLRKVFMKLGIRSRRELRTTLPALEEPGGRPGH